MINLEWLIEKLSKNDNLMLTKSIIKFIEDGDGRQIDRLYLLSYDREIASWRKELKCEWKKLQQKRNRLSQIPI